MMNQLQTMIPADLQGTYKSLLEYADLCIKYIDGKGFILRNRTDIPFKVRKALKPYMKLLNDIANAALEGNEERCRSLQSELLEMRQEEVNQVDQVLNQYFASKASLAGRDTDVHTSTILKEN